MTQTASSSPGGPAPAARTTAAPPIDEQLPEETPWRRFGLVETLAERCAAVVLGRVELVLLAAQRPGGTQREPQQSAG
jgi:hypothetical protein